jgi:hypothetical protein
MGQDFGGLAYTTYTAPWYVANPTALCEYNFIWTQPCPFVSILSVAASCYSGSSEAMAKVCISPKGENICSVTLCRKCLSGCSLSDSFGGRGEDKGGGGAQGALRLQLGEVSFPEGLVGRGRVNPS